MTPRDLLESTSKMGVLFSNQPQVNLEKFQEANRPGLLYLLTKKGGGGTLPKTNMYPKKGLFQWEIHLPTIDFQGTC